jgi:hypothetical protein
MRSSQQCFAKFFQSECKASARKLQNQLQRLLGIKPSPRPFWLVNIIQNGEGIAKLADFPLSSSLTVCYSQMCGSVGTCKKGKEAMTHKKNTTPSLVLRCAIPLRSATHGICVAKAIGRLYSGVSDIVSVADRRTVLGHSEIEKIEVAQD